MIAKIAVGWLHCTKIRGDPFRAQTDSYLIAQIVIESPIDIAYRQRSVTGTRRSQSQRCIIPSQKVNQNIICHKIPFYKTDIMIISFFCNIQVYIAFYTYWLRSSGDLWDLMATYWLQIANQHFVKRLSSPIKWRSVSDQMRPENAPLAMLEICGVQFPVWLRCRRPLLIRLRCTRSDRHDQIATCWLQSYKFMRRSDATIDI